MQVLRIFTSGASPCATPASYAGGGAQVKGGRVTAAALARSR